MADPITATKAAVTQNSISLFGYDFNFYGLFLLVAVFFFVFLFWKAQRNRRLDWVDIITRDGKFVSLTKILNLVGGFVGTWVIVQITAAGDMTWDILAVYLAYVASVEGFSKFILAKYQRDDTPYYNGGYQPPGPRPGPPGPRPWPPGPRAVAPTQDDTAAEASRLERGAAKAGDE